MTRKQKEEPKKKHYSSKLPWDHSAFNFELHPSKMNVTNFSPQRVTNFSYGKASAPNLHFWKVTPHLEETSQLGGGGIEIFLHFGSRALHFRKVSERSNFHQYAGRASVYLEKSDVSDCLWYTSLKKNEVGAWNHANKHHGGCCSGFPLEKTRVLLAGHERYLESCWEFSDKYLQHGLTNQGYP